MKLSGRLILAGLLLLGPGTVALAQSFLKARLDYIVGDHPVQVIAVDFDGDGNLDLLSVDRLSSQVSLLKGFGDGTFRRIGSASTGTYPGGAAFADMNNDGIDDIVASNFLSQDVTVNLGLGQGAFGGAISTRMPTTGNYVVVGDWNADGKRDVASLSTVNDSMSILLGTGTGTFGASVEITTGSHPVQAVTADFNADGKADIAVANNVADNVQVWRGNGTGGFTIGNTLPLGAGSGPVGIVAADFNGDSRPDLAVADNTSSNVKVYLVNGSGGFLPAVTFLPGEGPRSLTAADMNNDGNKDLVVGLSAQVGAGEIAILNGNGAGGFGAPSVVNTGPIPAFVAVGDFNGDGVRDVASANLTGGTVSLLAGETAGGFTVASAIPLVCPATLCLPTAVVTGDFNNDTKPDVAFANQDDDSLGVVNGNGLGGFGTMTRFSTGSLSGPAVVATLDENRDGRLDLVSANADNTLAYLQNNGTGGFTVTTGFPLTPCDSPEGIATGEISGDLFADIVIVCQLSGHMCTRRGTGGAGGSAFGPLACTIIDPNLPIGQISPGGVALGNYNFDALRDAAIPSTVSDWVYIAASDGAGGISDIPGTFTVGSVPQGVANGDVNGDGYDDIVVTNAESASLSALLGDGGGVFSVPSIDSPAGQGPDAVALADFNLDGKLDAAVVNGNSNDVSLLLGDGFGHFSKAGEYGTRDLPTALAVADFNMDGKPDIAVSDTFNDSITILQNQTVLTDPLSVAKIIGSSLTVFRWGLVPGAKYDVIRGRMSGVVKLPGSIDLGPVTCVADDIAETDTANHPDPTSPPLGDAYFYLVRPVIAGVPGPYTVATDGRQGTPSSGGCP